MADTLEFYPLYVIYHDQWGFRDWSPTWGGGWQPVNLRPHRGHCHFFMLGHEPELSGSSRAFTGSQTYNFSLEDEWSNRSKDPNKTDNVRIIGTPKWYFYIEEYWRRVYIQPWDSRKNKYISNETAKRGIKYEASSDSHTFGPFRECKGNFFFFNNMSRTLPLEYFSDENKTERDHYLKGGNNKWNLTDFSKNGGTDFIIPRNFWCGGDTNHFDGPDDEVKGRDFGYPDSYYIYPTIEYQVVKHLQWERPHGWESRDLDNNSFGDGLEIEISIPYKIDGKIQSPFSDDDGKVYPVGTYCHDFDSKYPDRVLKYPSVDYVDTVTEDGLPDTNPVNDKWRIPEELKGQKVMWNVPDNITSRLDGMWVEQCLGGIVRGKALVTLEDNFGGRREVWITSNNFIVNENFSGIDQGEPLDENN